MNRRIFLKSSFATLALPALESIPLAAETTAHAMAAKATPMRMVCIGNSFGMYPPAFFPKEAGPHYRMTELLAPLEKFRNRLTIFSHLDHGTKGGHFGVHSFLSGVRMEDAAGMPEGNISIDQRAAEHIGALTRFPSLTLGNEDGLHGGCRMCWTRSGIRVPPIEGPREVYRKLFINEGEQARKEASDHLALKKSILDSVHGQAQLLNRRLSTDDREKLDEYFTSIRDVENRLELDKKWSQVPKPAAGIAEPENRSTVEDIPVMFDLITAALKTDSTRIASYELAGQNFDTSFFGISAGYHNLSHHGQKEDKIKSLKRIEHYQMEQFARFLELLDSTPEPGTDDSLLDHTMVLFGSGMGNANAHVNKDLPIILAGGGFHHGEHRIYPVEEHRRIPLCNLYLSMLQRFGVATDSFGTSTGTLNGLEFA